MFVSNQLLATGVMFPGYGLLLFTLLIYIHRMLLLCLTCVNHFDNCDFCNLSLRLLALKPFMLMLLKVDIFLAEMFKICSLSVLGKWTKNIDDSS